MFRVHDPYGEPSKVTGFRDRFLLGLGWGVNCNNAEGIMRVF